VDVRVHGPERQEQLDRDLAVGERAYFAGAEQTARDRLGADAYQSAWRSGRNLTPGQAVAAALAE
jgi:hypothetical protein